MGDNGEDEQGGEVGAKGEHEIAGMTDTDFAVSVDALLWVTPLGKHRDNAENFKAVGWSLEELETSAQLLNDLLDHLIALTSWREHPQLAAPVLEALLFTEALAGQRETPEPKV
ncbi:hypothetical protein BH24DEI2_BH24DEI2_03210 [soil metagenome]